MMDSSVLLRLSEFLERASKKGLFPIVAYGLDGDNMLLLTTNIPDLPLAFRVLREVSGKEYNLGYNHPRPLVSKIAMENPHSFRLNEQIVPDLSKQDVAEIGRVVSVFGAPFFQKKAFALVDICGFSRLSYAEQLSQLYGLTNAIASSTRRTGRFCTRLGVDSSFGQSSTGDGFYLWNQSIGYEADVSTFMLLLCVMVQSEAMRKRGFPMRLRGAYVIDSAFMIYNPLTVPDPSAKPSNAVGEATNGAARLLTGARPSQILMGEFSRTGQRSELITPKALISQASELFREEGFGAASIVFHPDKMLRFTDKHKEPWYCWNVVAQIPNNTAKEMDRLTVGLEPDPTQELGEIAFELEPRRV